MLKPLDGKKTSIGMALAILAQVVPAIFGDAADGVAQVINYAAMLFGGAGLGHKAYKGLTHPAEAK